MFGSWLFGSSFGESQGGDARGVVRLHQELGNELWVDRWAFLLCPRAGGMIGRVEFAGYVQEPSKGCLPLKGAEDVGDAAMLVLRKPFMFATIHALDCPYMQGDGRRLQDAKEFLGKIHHRPVEGSKV